MRLAGEDLMVGSTRRRGLVLAVLTLLATTAFSACGSSGNGSGATSDSGSSAAPASIGSLVTASKSENALNVYANIPAELFKHVLDQFTSLYPWIKVNDNELSDPEIFSKVTAEQAQGAPSADLMISTYPLGFAQAGRRGTAPHRITDLPSHRVRRCLGLHDPEGRAGVADAGQDRQDDQDHRRRHDPAGGSAKGPIRRRVLLEWSRPCLRPAVQGSFRDELHKRFPGFDAPWQGVPHQG